MILSTLAGVLSGDLSGDLSYVGASHPALSLREGEYLKQALYVHLEVSGALLVLHVADLPHFILEL